MLLPLLQNNLLETAGATAEVAATLTESGIVAGGGEITLTLANDTWVTAGATFDAQRQAILDGFTATTLDLSTQSVTTVVRTSDTLVTITLEAVSGYSIGADETVSVTVPGAALTGGSDLDAGSFVVTDDVGAKAGGRTRRKIRYIVEVEGERIEVSSLTQAQSVLQQAAELAEQSAPQDVRRAGARVKPPKVTVKTASGQKTTSKVLADTVKTAQSSINAIYRKAYEAIEQEREISRLIQKKIERDEDDEEAVLLLIG